ncbi:MAG TPA: glycosyltransferase [Stellaceae bacterium]|nr:glycosyltransferase [Stellaceae bacterium]
MHIAIVTPVLDDWDSLRHLLIDLGRLFRGQAIRLHVLVVDDGSSMAPDIDDFALPPGEPIVELQIVHLAMNLGHQRAIAIGLTEIARRHDIDAVVVMDSDGEDRPADVARLLALFRADAPEIIVAARAKRSETPIFKAGYYLYRLLFQLMTGSRISFGNFSLLSPGAARRLVRMPELWNNLAGSIMRSRLPRHEMPVARGERYAGTSRMNFTALIVHGLSAMSIFTDRIFVRILMAAAGLGLCALLGMFTVAGIRLFTSLAIPGWASTIILALFVILIQTGLLVTSVSLLLLGARTNRPVIPVLDCDSFVLRRQRRLVEGEDLFLFADRSVAAE